MYLPICTKKGTDSTSSQPTIFCIGWGAFEMKFYKNYPDKPDVVKNATAATATFLGSMMLPIGESKGYANVADAVKIIALVQ